MRLVWDTCALVSLVRSADSNHLAAYEIWEEHREQVSIFPALAYFEFQATVSAIRRDGGKAIREMYLLDDKNIVLPLDAEFVHRCSDANLADQFPNLRGGDLVFACAAALEKAALVTFDIRLRKNATGLTLLPEQFAG
jgi:hypothetical protein